MRRLIPVRILIAAHDGCVVKSDFDRHKFKLPIAVACCITMVNDALHVTCSVIESVLIYREAKD